MAFKKSTEGRVYFQGTGNGGDPVGDTGSPVKASAPARLSGQSETGPTQLQILALLHALNDKLRTSQTERNTMRAELEEYRRAMDALQDRAYKGERAEKVAQETLKELAETRKIVLDIEERQAGIEKETKMTAEKIRVGVGSYRDLVKRLESAEQKQENVARQLAEATTQQAKIMRQIEKTVEDRARFMRKIERIEETVVQTRDALNAKAMVLLTDQNISGGGPVPSEAASGTIAQEPGIPTAIPDEDLIPQPWGVSRSLQAAAIALLVVGGILAGWAVSETQRPQQVLNAGEFQITDTNTPVEKDSAPVANADEAAGKIINKWSTSEDISAFAEEAADPAPVEQAPVAAATPASDPADDIGTIDLNDTAKIQQMLESDPDGLAAALNNLEPGDSMEETAPAEETRIASLPPRETPDIDQEQPSAGVSTPAAEQSPSAAYIRRNVNFRDLISADSRLPGAIKNIETQAFDGVPEAQHDLAAIYTAGHGGVKQDFKRALFWFEQAAESNVANAAYNLGVLNQQGLGTKPDLEKAIGWYTKAAALGHPEAQYNLGIAYIEGVGVAYDPVKANAYFEKAAAQGIMEAAYNLGLIYENGLLGKPEPDRALIWYKEAADKGSPEAKAALEQLAKTLNIRMEEINKLVDNAKRTGKGASSAVPATHPDKTASIAQKTGVRNSTDNAAANVTLAQIQERLMGLGLYPGPADGADSPLSQDAIRAYQQLNGMEATGNASDALLVHMLSNDSGKISAQNGYN
jgi:TPR repeat protein